jgi:inorganic pyrophosphatase
LNSQKMSVRFMSGAAFQRKNSNSRFSHSKPINQILSGKVNDITLSEMEFRYAQNMTAFKDRQPDPPEVEVVIEIPRGSFLKRGSNYGCVPAYIGGEGDLLDAVVLGPRLPLGSRVKVRAWGAIGLSERFMYDDKLICSVEPLRDRQRDRALRFFHFYARCKGWLNFWRGRRGATRCEGWGSADAAIARAQPIGPDWRGPKVPY